MIVSLLNLICRSNHSYNNQSNTALEAELYTRLLRFITTALKRVFFTIFKYNHQIIIYALELIMTESQRHQLLLEMLQQTGFVTVEQVIDRLQVSPATARRDINKLGESGKLKKVRNGAEAVSQNRVAWTPMNIHQAQNHEEKVRIARAASQLVKPGESIVINCGSTAFTLGREICGKDAQVITNYLPLANFLIEQEHDSVVIIGGQYNRSQAITLAPQEGESSLYAGHWMFTSGKGLTAEGLYKTDMLTAMAEQKMLNYVGKLVVLADSSKVGQRAGMLFSRAEQIDIVITGKAADEKVIEQLKAQGVEVILV